MGLCMRQEVEGLRRTAGNDAASGVTRPLYSRHPKKVRAFQLVSRREKSLSRPVL